MKPTTSIRKDSYKERISSVFFHLCCNHSVFEKKIEEIMLYIDTNRRLGYNSRSLPNTDEVVSFPIMVGASNMLKDCDNLFQLVPQYDRERFIRMIVWNERYLLKDCDIESFMRNLVSHLNHSNLTDREFVIEIFRDTYTKHFSLNKFTTTLFAFFLLMAKEAIERKIDVDIVGFDDRFRNLYVKYFYTSIYASYTGGTVYRTNLSSYSKKSPEINIPLVYDREADCILLEIPLETIYRNLAYSSINAHSDFIIHDKLGIFSPIYKTDDESKELKKNIKKSNIDDNKMNVIYAHLKVFILDGITEKCAF